MIQSRQSSMSCRHEGRQESEKKFVSSSIAFSFFNLTLDLPIKGFVLSLDITTGGPRGNCSYSDTCREEY